MWWWRTARGVKGVLVSWWSSRTFSTVSTSMKNGCLLLSLRVMVVIPSVLVLKHLDDITGISKSGLQLLLRLSRFQDGRIHLLLCSGCSPANVFQQNRNNELQHDIFVMLWLYFSLISGESVDTEAVSIETFCLHHIRQLLSAGFLLSGSPERARKRTLSAYSCAIFLVIRVKETPLISTCLPSSWDAATAPCSGTKSQWHTTATQVLHMPDCALRRDANYPMLCSGDKNHH